MRHSRSVTMRRSIASKSRRLFIGLFLLIFVNILWVASSELTRYIFKEANFGRPFFTTYMKTCMFTIYLLGFMFHRPWRDQCVHGIPDIEYREVDVSDEEAEIESSSLSRNLSEPEFEPINSDIDGDSDQSSEQHSALFHPNDDPPADPVQTSSRRPSVRFNQLQEVRRMPECEAEYAKTARLPYEVWQRLRRLAIQYKHRLTVRNVAQLAFTFTFFWFIGNLGYQEALSYTTPGVVNVLSSSSSLFTVILAALFPSCATDRITLSKLCLVAMNIGGVVIITIVDKSSKFEGGRPLGVIWALIGAIGYALYLVLLRRRVDSEEKLDISMFFGFVGLFAMVLLWPIIYVLNVTNLEAFYPLPSRTQFLCILLNGLIGTVLSEYIWLWGCFLTSSLMATLSLSLTVPMTVIADIVLWEDVYPWQFFLGTAPILMAFFGSALLNQYDNSDPVYEALRLVCQKLLHIPFALLRSPRLSPSRRLSNGRTERDIDREQVEALITA